MNNRLLSYEDKLQAIQKCQTRQDFENCVAKAQLSMTDKEWVDIIQIQQEVCLTHKCKYDLSVCDFCGATCNWWQERKKELGI